MKRDTSEVIAALLKLARHADDCLSTRPLDTGAGNWHCTCGYDRVILDGQLAPDFATLSAAEPADAGRDAVYRRALEYIVRVMGPKVPPCCEGCEFEWGAALSAAREALASQQVKP